MAGITWGIISMTATFFLRLTRQSTAWMPISPAPMTAVCRAPGIALSMLMASCRVMHGETPRSLTPGMGRITAEEPLATRRVSYFSVFRLDSFTVRALGSTWTAATPVRTVALICLA